MSSVILTFIKEKNGAVNAIYSNTHPPKTVAKEGVWANGLKVQHLNNPHTLER